MREYRLSILDPGHFHAALLFRSDNARVHKKLNVYARKGPELDAFCALIDGFNKRPDSPTRWELALTHSDDPQSALIDAGATDAAVIAGRNDRKLAQIKRLHEASIPVLADKPWLTAASDLPLLDAVTHAAPLVMDIMTSRVDRYARLRKAIVADGELFGSFVDDGEPAFSTDLMHHLYKRVDGKPLRRPIWYFDTRVQGDGLTDIQSHLVDQAQWLCGPGGLSDSANPELSFDSARIWPTKVSPELFEQCTGSTEFPAELAHKVGADGDLALDCNGEIDYRANGVRIRQRARWLGREPEGSGDQIEATLRGTSCSVLLRIGPETSFRPRLRLEPNRKSLAEVQSVIDDRLGSWQAQHPGLEVARDPSGLIVQLPRSTEGGHETHFPLVLNGFIDRLDANQWSAVLAERIRDRYTLLAQAQSSAVAIDPSSGHRP